MKKILVLGAGRSASCLIRYLGENSAKEQWEALIADRSMELATEATNGFEGLKPVQLDVADVATVTKMVTDADVVISMLPAFMHPEIARICVAKNTHMVTASYVSDEMKVLDEQAKANGIVLMNEIGVDPGIDHMSAMRVMDEVRGEGHELTDFESFTGGLVAPESDDNPWNYKFTWNPRNVVLAGQGGAVKFIQEGQYKYIPYHKLFRRTELIKIDGHGRFEGYANRDSLKYRDIYGLQDIQTMFRGTLRRPGFCRGWNMFVQLGATDDSYVLENSENMTHRDFINTFLAYNPHDSVELKLSHYLSIEQDDIDLWEKLHYLDVFSDEKIGLKEATPAQILQHILEKKWSLKEDDKDMIVMWHKFIYNEEGKQRERHSSMVCIGEDSHYTAMAKTVGLPVAIATKMILNGTICTPGVHRPTTKEIYNPVLDELEDYGIAFNERQIR